MMIRGHLDHVAGKEPMNQFVSGGFISSFDAPQSEQSLVINPNPFFLLEERTLKCWFS